MSYFEVLSKFFLDYEEEKYIVEEESIDLIIKTAKHHQQTLSEIYCFLTDRSNNDDINGVDLVILQDILHTLRSLEVQLKEIVVDLKGKYPAKQRIVLDQMCLLRSLGISWTEISSIFGVSCMSLYLKRKKAGIADDFQFTEISDDELQEEIRKIKQEMPDVGEKMVSGILFAKDIHVQRRRIREAIHAVDPINTALRWHKKIFRRIYSVPGPMSLWHIGWCACIILVFCHTP